MNKKAILFGLLALGSFAAPINATPLQVIFGALGLAIVKGHIKLTTKKAVAGECNRDEYCAQLLNYLERFKRATPQEVELLEQLQKAEALTDSFIIFDELCTVIKLNEWTELSPKEQTDKFIEFWNRAPQKVTKNN